MKQVFDESAASQEYRQEFFDIVTEEYKKIFGSVDTNHYRAFGENMAIIYAKYHSNDDHLNYQANLFLGKIRPLLKMPPPPPVVDLSRDIAGLQASAEASKLGDSAQHQGRTSVHGGTDEEWRSDPEVNIGETQPSDYCNKPWTPPSPYGDTKYTKEVQDLRWALHLCQVPDLYHVGIITLGGINTINTFASMSTTKWSELAKSIVKGSMKIFINDNH